MKLNYGILDAKRVLDCLVGAGVDLDVRLEEDAVIDDVVILGRVNSLFSDKDKPITSIVMSPQVVDTIRVAADLHFGPGEKDVFRFAQFDESVEISDELKHALDTVGTEPMNLVDAPNWKDVLDDIEKINNGQTIPRTLVDAENPVAFENIDIEAENKKYEVLHAAKFLTMVASKEITGYDVDTDPETRRELKKLYDALDADLVILPEDK